MSGILSANVCSVDCAVGVTLNTKCPSLVYPLTSNICAEGEMMSIMSVNSVPCRNASMSRVRNGKNNFSAGGMALFFKTAADIGGCFVLVKRKQGSQLHEQSRCRFPRLLLKLRVCRRD